MIRDTESNLAIMIGGFILPVGFYAVTNGAFPWWVYAVSVPGFIGAIYGSARQTKAQEAIIEQNDRDRERNRTDNG